MAHRCGRLLGIARAGTPETTEAPPRHEAVARLCANGLAHTPIPHCLCISSPASAGLLLCGRYRRSVHRRWRLLGRRHRRFLRRLLWRAGGRIGRRNAGDRLRRRFRRRLGDLGSQHEPALIPRMGAGRGGRRDRAWSGRRRASTLEC